MRVEIRDAQALAGLSLVDVRAYLVTQGWRPEGRYGEVATIFVVRDSMGREHETLLPLREDIADFPTRMADIIASIAEVEGRPQLSVYSDLVRSGFDILRLRAFAADDAGTIQLENGVALYDNARDLIAASANAAIKPKRVYTGNTPERAKTYLNDLRLGQTEVGSYILTILSPVRPSLEPEQLSLLPDDSDEPFARSVTRTLAKAIRATKHAVTEASATGKLLPFEASIDSGVSANLCEAIARLAQEGSGVDISLTWSRVRPGPEPTAIQTFTVDNSRVLSEVAAAFRDKEPL